MNKIKIAVLCSGGGTNFQAILSASDAGMLPDGEIKLVVTDYQEAFVLKRAQRAGIKAETVDCKQVPDRAEREAKIEQILQENQIDLIVLAGFMTILSERFVKKYPERIINVHPALIPSFCGKGFYGLHVHEAALKAGVKVTGATVHYVNEICDGGKIILQKAVAVQEEDTPETLQKRVMREAEWVILPEAVEMVCKKLRGAK